ncbi:hypothetical protein DFH07DRAFT_965721 [Mycena maculata]|uniref:Uncharacterized protein n=1 Tax=Mycena maculata TaxID=230809 RepID=A0AAD7IDN2_9AGAR|nr:hypothetical protein DFH07DRAFT_965721 [Mycena maculata]
MHGYNIPTASWYHLPSEYIVNILGDNHSLFYVFLPVSQWDKEMLPEHASGYTYKPTILPDHRGDYFNHNRATLVQHNYKDTDGSLIAPYKPYGKLTDRTLILVMVSLVTYVIKMDGGKNKMASTLSSPFSSTSQLC